MLIFYEEFKPIPMNKNSVLHNKSSIKVNNKDDLEDDAKRTKQLYKQHIAKEDKVSYGLKKNKI